MSSRVFAFVRSFGGLQNFQIGKAVGLNVAAWQSLNLGLVFLCKRIAEEGVHLGDDLWARGACASRNPESSSPLQAFRGRWFCKDTWPQEEFYFSLIVSYLQLHDGLSDYQYHIICVRHRAVRSTNASVSFIEPVSDFCEPSLHITQFAMKLGVASWIPVQPKQDASRHDHKAGNAFTAVPRQCGTRHSCVPQMCSTNNNNKSELLKVAKASFPSIVQFAKASTTFGFLRLRRHRIVTLPSGALEDLV